MNTRRGSAFLKLGSVFAGWIRLLFSSAHWLLSLLFGRLSWQAPVWLLTSRAAGGKLAAYGRAHPKPVLAIVAVLAAAGGGGWYGWQWYQAQPKPETVSFKVTAPARTEIESQSPPRPLVVEFSGPAAPLPAVGKPVGTGIFVEPVVGGTWTWAAENRLEFQPKADWPVGAEYRVSFSRTGLFRDDVLFEEHGFTFATAAFEAKIGAQEFHLDPTRADGKTAEFTVNFSHPVDTAAFEKLVSLRMEGQKEGFLGFGGETTPFTVSYDKLKLNAYIHSMSLPIPEQATHLTLTVAAGARAAAGGPAVTNKLDASVAIPGAYGLTLNEVSPTVVTNDQQEPERILLVNLSAPVEEKEVARSLKAWLLPARHPKQAADDKGPHYWSAAEVSPAILKLAQPVSLAAIPGEREFEEQHSYRFHADVGRYLYVTVDKGVRSFHGYRLRDNASYTFQIEAFPPALNIIGQGSLLSMSGDKRVAVMTRDIPGVRFEIGRLLPQQIQHLVSQTDGSFSQPEFNGRLTEEHVTERFEKLVPLPGVKEGKLHYESLDLSKYLDNGGNSRRGVFLLTVTRFDPNAGKPAPNEQSADAGDSAEGEGESAQPQQVDDQSLRDRRLILVTDLGIVIKKSMAGTYDVFVQSLHTGAPIPEASVDIIAKNGQTLLTQTTDAGGRVGFPTLADYAHEKTPLMFLVRKGGDMSFLPIDRHDRQLDLSRFDIGGIVNPRSQEQLSAYLFSDRGVYRPGDAFHIGMIVRPADWKKDIAGVPLEVDVTDPRGLVIKREKLKLPASGFAEFTHTTLETAPTGSYTINLSLIRGDQQMLPLGSTSIKVQEFLPDRMKIAAHLSDEVGEGWVKPDNLKATVNVANLFGTPAQDRRVEASLSLTPAFVSFPNYRDYQFYDPQRAKESFNDKLSDAKTNDKGEAEFDLHLERFAAATYRLHLLARAFEPEGGRSVAAETGVMVSSLPYLVGIKPDGELDYVTKNAARKLHVIAIDPKAKKTAVDKLTLALIERKYVSVLTKQDNGTYKFQSRRKESTVSENIVAIPAAGLDYVLPTATPGNYVLSLRDQNGLELNRVEFSVAGEANVSRTLDRNAELQLALDKKDYAPGEDIEISVKAPYTGAGLITIERDKVYAHAWFKATTTASVQKIRVPKDFEGNGYVNVQFLRDPGSNEIYMSPLSYGVAPFSVNLAARRNPVSIRFAEQVKPGDTLKFKVRADKPAQAVVFAVDEGILQVAGYQNADPLAYFFQKRMLEVKTSQILDLLLPEFQKLMEAAAPGGDTEGALGRHLNPFKRKRDKPAVFWSGIVNVGPTEREISYTVPDSFNGTLRVMAVAVNPQTVGIFSGQTVARGDLILQPNVPSMVAPGDEFEVSVGVANNLRGSGKDAAVGVQLKTSPHLQVVGESKQELKIGEMREGTAVFRLRALDKLGSATLTVTGSVGGKAAKIATDTSVRPATPYTVQVAAGSFGGSKFELPVSRRLYDEYRQVQASISPLPLTLAPGLVAYLEGFPYSCTEQLTSKGLAGMIVSQHPDLGRIRTEKGEDTARAFASLINVLRSRQNEEGGFGLWEATHETHEFATVYALLFLMEAKDRGQPVPRDMLDAGMRYLDQFAATSPNSLAEARLRAQAAYLLAKNGQVTSNYVAGIQQYLERNHAKDWQQDIAAGYLAAAYQLMKQDRQANTLITPLETRLRTPVAQRDRNWYYADYYDPAIRDAMTLYLLSAHFPKRAQALPPKALEALVAPVAQGNFNTLSSALTLLALDTYVKSVGGDGKMAKMAIQEILADGNARPLALTSGLVAKGAVTQEARKLRFDNGSDLSAYYGLVEAGFDHDLPSKEIKDGIEVYREYVDAAGKPVTSVHLGEEITVHLKIRSTGHNYVGDIALVDLLPGGFEPVMQSAAPASQEGEGDGDAAAQPVSAVASRFGSRGSTWPVEEADIREDRIVLYGSAEANLQEFVYRLRATNAGTFQVPPAYAESMYERGIRARSLPRKMTVEK